MGKGNIPHKSDIPHRVIMCAHFSPQSTVFMYTHTHIHTHTHTHTHTHWKTRRSTLKCRRYRGDMTETYKILHGRPIYDTTVARDLPICQDSVTRGNSCRLVKNFFRYDVQKYCFTQRIVCHRALWFVISSSVNSFKNNLDKFWISQKVNYNF